MPLGTQTVDQFLCDLASKEPTPGGGAVAGILAGLSTSLGNMVLAYSAGKKSLAEHAALHNDCMTFLQTAKNEALVLGDADADAYYKVSALWKLPKDDPKRIEQWDSTLADAIKIPLQTMELSQRILLTLQTLVGKTNPLLSSDLAIAAILAESAARAAHWNVGVNAMQMENDEQRATFVEQSLTILTSCKKLALLIEQSCKV